MSEEMKNQMEVVAESQEEPMDMGALLEQYGDAAEDIGRGKVVKGTIVSKVTDGWLVDVGYKCEGFLPEREWTHHILVDDKPEPAQGDEVTVQVTNKRDGEEAQLVVSRWRCEFDRRWEELEKKVAANEPFTVRGLRKVKGGLMVNCCSLEGFIPLSQLSEDGRGVNPGRFVDEDLEVCLLEKDKRKRRLVLSRRSLLEEELGQKREKFYTDVHVGDILDGVVSSLTSFGAFVNVGPLDGLVHVSELSWQRSSKAREALKKGDQVKVKVIAIDKENNKISLSIRQAQGDPWDTVMERWAKDQKTKGVVTNVTEFGAFVEVEPGIEGLIHIGDLSWSRIKHPRDVLRKGQEVDTIVLDIDPVKRRMSLGYKQLNDPWNGIDEKYTKGQDIAVKVVRLADFGAFVEIEKGVEGLIHISQLSTHRVEKPGDVLAEGQEVAARILEINPADRRIRLSISAIEAGEQAAEQQERPERAERSEKRRDASAKGEKPAGKPRRARNDSEKSFNTGFQDEGTGFTFGDALGDFKLDEN
ncbi:MAG: S1 RNA-binding domain-containing protein [Pyramidobacter sp.]|nr:S1 RNA-binding domain-containing protein [Pyramidobacter sp.]